jgi:hypothetical protein
MAEGVAHAPLVADSDIASGTDDDWAAQSAAQ